MRADGQNMGRVALQEPAERLKDLQRERSATDAAVAGAVLDFEIGWLYEELGQIKEAAEAYLRGLTSAGSFRPNLSALIRLAEQTSADPRGLYEAALRQSATSDLQLSARIDIAYLGLATDSLDHDLLRSLVVAAQDQDRVKPTADLGVALELVALRLGEEELSRLGRDLLLDCSDLGKLHPFLFEERLWDALRNHSIERTCFVRTVEDVQNALRSLDKSNKGRRAAVLELASSAARHADRPALEADWLSELASFVLTVGDAESEDLDTYSFIVQQQVASPRTLAAALLFEASDAYRQHGQDQTALSALRKAQALSSEASALDRMIIAESLMLAAERVGELEDAGTIARSLLELEVPTGREQILWLRLSALEHARGELEGAIVATGHALKTHVESIAARATLLGYLAQAERDSDRIEALEGWARYQSGETRSLLFWQAAHLAAQHATSSSDGAVAALFEAAIAASDHAEEILRAYADWSGARHDHIEALLRLSTDPLERAVLKRQRWVRDHSRLDTDGETALTEILEDEDCHAWAPAVVRHYAAQLGRFDLLARAHERSAQNAPTDVKVAHLLAAARAQIRNGTSSRAEPLLQEVLRLDDRNAYGIAMLSAVLRSEGHDVQRVALLSRVASKEDERTAAQRKTHAAAHEAERHGLSESAARSYQAFLQRYPETPAIAWCLLRLADRTRNMVWREQALETLASYERQSGYAGYATLRWIEHLALLAHRTTAQQGALESALAFAASQPSIAPAAAVWTAVLAPPTGGENDTFRALRAELLALAELETDWRRAELASGAHLFMLITGKDHDDAFLHAHTQFERQPTTQTALSSLESVPWTAPDALGTRWEEVAAHWETGLTVLHEQATEFVDTSLLARWHLHNDRKENAMELAEQAVSEDPDDLASWMVLRNAALALQHWETFVQANEIVAEPLTNETRAQLKTLSGFACAFGLGDTTRATSYFLEALELDPLNDDAFGWVQQHLRGRQRNRLVEPLRTRIDNTDDAEELLDLHLDLAMAHQAGGEFRKAVVVLEQALLFDEEDEHVLAGVAEIWIYLEEWERAQAALVSLARVAKQTDMFDACILSAANILHAQLSADARGVALVEQAYESIASKMPALEMLTSMLETQGEFQRAASYAQQAITRTAYAERQPWLLRLGRLQEKAGMVEAARESYREALDASPSDLQAFEALLRCGMQGEERRIRARQLVAGLRDRLACESSTDFLRAGRELGQAARWNENFVLERCAQQVFAAVSEQADQQANTEHARRLIWRANATDPFTSIVPRIRQRPESPHDRAANRLQDLLLSILEHALEAYGVVTPLEPTDPMAQALNRASISFGFENTPVFRSTQGDDALGLVLGSDRNPAWVVGPNFELVGGALSASKSFIIGQLGSAYALGVLPFVVREHSNAVGIWKSLRIAAGRSTLRSSEQRFEETLRARIPKQFQLELEPLLRQTTNRQFRRWCEEAYDFVLRAAACFSGEIATPLRAIQREGTAETAKERLLRYWLTADAETALRHFWSAS